MPTLGIARLRLSIGGAVLVLLWGCSTTSDRAESVLRFPDQGREHLTTGSPVPGYNSNPPTSGPHAPNTVPCGVHEEPIPDPVLVHNLEHGVVAVHYSPDIAADQLAELTGAVTSLPGHILLAPRPDNPSLVVLSAWTVQMRLDAIDVGAIQWFWDEFSGTGPEQAACPVEQVAG